MSRSPKFPKVVEFLHSIERKYHRLIQVTLAVLLTPSDDEDLERLVPSRSPRFQALLNQSRQSLQAGKGLSRDSFWQAVAGPSGEEKGAVPRKRKTA